MLEVPLRMSSGSRDPTERA